jgi:hypothetical protein
MFGKRLSKKTSRIYRYNRKYAPSMGIHEALNKELEKLREKTT